MPDNFIDICGRRIGPGFNPLIIAELGINHGGKLEVAFEMVDAAKRAGVEIIKHQTHIPNDEMSKAAKMIIPSHTKESIFNIIAKCSLLEHDEIELKKYVESNGMIFISTPFSREAANRLIKMDVPAFKIGSGECNNYPLIKHIASFGKPIILSTGMNNLDSISKAVDIIRESKVQFALLHTTNLYPTPDNLVRLGAMTQLSQRFPDAIIGLSDHTTSNLACYAAIPLGASILERHFTDTMYREGPDIACSMDETECKQLIINANKIFSMLGGTKEPAEEEKSTKDFAFASVVTTKIVKKGDLFTYENIWVKRPGIGEVLAEDFESIIGKSSSRDIDSDEMLKLSDIQ